MRHPPKAACIALAIAAVALPTVPLTTPASAATSAQCTRYAASPPVSVNGSRTKTATLSGCTPFSATGGSSYSVTDVTTHVSTITWVAGNGTTILKVTYKGGPEPNKCPSGSHLTISGGTVTGGSGAVLGTIKVGDNVSARLCVRPTLAASLEPGSTFKFVGAQPPTVPSGNSPPPAVPLPKGVSACPAGTIRTMVALVNRDRKKTGNLPPLAENANLDWAARKHSIVMATQTGPSHEGWDREIAESRFVAGPPYAAGQNIAVGPQYPLDLVEAGFFDEKPPHDGHRLNILNTSFHKIGIGCVIQTSTGLWSWTQNFGS